MSFSIEKRIWYLTEKGWVEGDFYYDTGGFDHVAAPEKFAAVYEYVENYSSPFDKNPTILTKCKNVIDEKNHERLLMVFGNCPRSF